MIFKQLNIDVKKTPNTTNHPYEFFKRTTSYCLKIILNIPHQVHEYP